MKIGLIGNMNNNNFALMRYFRDLGADAHLLLYSNDGKGTLSHFTPEADTWEIERWSPFIHQTDIPNGPIAAFDFPVSYAIELGSKLIGLPNALDGHIKSVTRMQLRRAYHGYDRLIGSGSTPAALERINCSLDLFYPYSTGIEFFNSVGFNVQKRLWYVRPVYKALRRRQLRGLLRAKSVAGVNLGSAENILRQLGILSIPLMLPMLYSRENYPENPPTSTLAGAFQVLNYSGFSLLHHARLIWTKPEHYSVSEHLSTTKNSDWVIRSFASLVAARSNVCPRMFIMEYGPDVEATKKLVANLGIDSWVTWLPKMSRRELMWLLRRVSIGVGEFYTSPRTIWGGTGWETLASGKPLLQGYHFSENEFEAIYGYPPPPILPVKDQDDVLEHLFFVADNPFDATEIGLRARQWFDSYNGSALAKKWLKLVTNPGSSPNERL